MYKQDRQMKFEDFVFPYGKLDAGNDWVKLVEIMPWDKIEERYSAKFVNNGHPAHPARMAIGALIIRERLKCSDEWTVKHISENPYLQYFIGMKEYSGICPFGASTMVAFRKRFSEEEIAEILEMTIPKQKPPEDDDPHNGGTLIMDATCCPADIAYPQDNKKRTAKQIKMAIRRQLQYIRRDIGYIARFVKDGARLTVIAAGADEPPDDGIRAAADHA